MDLSPTAVYNFCWHRTSGVYYTQLYTFTGTLFSLKMFKIRSFAYCNITKNIVSSFQVQLSILAEKTITVQRKKVM